MDDEKTNDKTTDKDSPTIQQQQQTVKSDEQKKLENLDEEIPKINFQCYLCTLNEQCDYKGDRPPFAGHIKLAEQSSYVMKDPFSPKPDQQSYKSEYFLILGADCSLCRRPVCKDTNCSIFYINTYCLKCAVREDRHKEFPLEIRTKIKKQIAAANSSATD